MKAFLIVNPVAGRKQILQKIKLVISLLENSGYNITTYYTKCKGDATNATIQNGSQYDVIICCGGDGTLSEVVNGIYALKTKPKLGYIPAGTTNDFGISLGLPKDIIKATKLIINGKTQPLDVIKFYDKIFMYVASFGAFTQTSYSTPQGMKNLFGHFAYMLEGVKEFATIKPYHLKITLPNNKIIEDEYIFGAITNSTSIGGLIKLKAKDISFYDGIFEVLLIKKPNNLIDLNKILYSLNTFDYNNDFTTFLQSDKLNIECDEQLKWSLDGESYYGQKDFNVEVLNKAINFLVP